MLGLSALAVSGLSTPAQTVGKAPSVDSSKVGPDGTAYIARVVPVPKTISLEAQNFLAQPGSDVAGPPSTLEQDRTGVDQWQSGAGEVSKRLYPVTVTGAVMAGVPVRIVTPPRMAREREDRVLMNLHGGGFALIRDH